MSGREDKARGTWDETKGKVKEGWGDLTNDRDVEAEGGADQAKGKG
ncbi:MAG: CsbD family protein, partial [Vicinamibacterales bacterium]